MRRADHRVRLVAVLRELRASGLVKKCVKTRGYRLPPAHDAALIG